MTVRILLDTHFVLWFAHGDERMPLELRSLIENPENAVFASESSLLEITIKHAKNPVAMPYSGNDFVTLCQNGQIGLRPITRQTILAYGSLAFEKVGDLHRDPFDRLLIAQAKSENLVLATHDRLLALYGEPLVKVYA